MATLEFYIYIYKLRQHFFTGRFIATDFLQIGQLVFAVNEINSGAPSTKRSQLI
jgi:hypothetical protein